MPSSVPCHCYVSVISSASHIQGGISPTGVNLCLINVVYTASPWMPKTVGVFPGIPAVCVSLVKSLISVLPKGGGICFIINIWEFFIASGCKSLVRDGFCKDFLLVCGLSSFSYQSLHRTKVFMLMKSNLWIFYFMDRVFGVRSKKTLPFQGHKDFSPRLLEVSLFCVSYLSLCYIWVVGVLRFFFSLTDIHLFQYNLLKGFFCCWKWIDHVYVGLFWFSVLFHWSNCLHTVLITVALLSVLKSSCVSSPALLLFKIALALLDCLLSIYTSESACPFQQKNSASVWIKSMQNEYIGLGRITVLTILSLLIWEHCKSLHLLRFSLFLSQVFRSFQHTDPEHVLLDLYLNILLIWSYYKWYFL